MVVGRGRRRIEGRRGFRLSRKDEKPDLRVAGGPIYEILKTSKNSCAEGGGFGGSVGQVLLVITEPLVEVGVILSSGASYWAVCGRKLNYFGGKGGALAN